MSKQTKPAAKDFFRHGDNPDKAFVKQASYKNAALELRGTLYLHETSGARVLDIQNDDSENLLSVLFRTPPTDSSGLPHILEHAVLGGSRKYAVKDPFFHMLKMSLATFLNAMTGPDYTIYPCASNVAADFFNLAEVYLDAVFHPLLSPAHFKQEGYHFSFDPPGDANGRLTVKGIVYNEMRGAYSSPNERLQRLIERGLFPDSPYRHDAGGDPDCILDLSYENLLAYHRNHYHPANALILRYGNIPAAEWMPFLDARLGGFAPMEPAAFPEPQPRWSKPRLLEDAYPVGAGESTSQRTYLGMSWLTLHHPSPLEQMAMQALFLILAGHAAAPLRRALIDSGLGHDLTHTYVHDFGRESTFHIGIKGAETDRRTAFEELVVNTLKDLSRPGAIDTGMINTALTRLGYVFQEISEGYPLTLASRIYQSWIIGDDPFVWLNGGAVIDDLRAVIQRQPDYFAHGIRTLLLDNPHRLTTVLRPDPEFGARQESAIDAGLQRRRAAMTPAIREQVKRETQELELFQQRPEPAEAIDSLPQLKAGDLPRQPRLIPTTRQHEPGNLTVLRNAVPSNGVNYLDMAVDIASFNADDTRLANALHTNIALQMGAAGQDYAAMSRRIAAHTGNINYELLTTTSRQRPDRLVLRLLLKSKFLDSQVEPALEVLRDMLFKPEFDDRIRLTQLLAQLREKHHGNVVEHALSYAMPLAARHTGGINGLVHHISGLAELRQVDYWHAQYARNPDVLPLRLKAISEYIAGAEGWVASFTGSDKAYETFSSAWRDWQTLRSKSIAPETVQSSENEAVLRPDPKPPRHGLAAPMDVAFNVMCLPLPHVSHADSVYIEIGAHLLSFDYLLDEIRFKGSAYGGGCAYRPDCGVAHLYSYRDPSIARTIKVFNGLPAAARRANWNKQDIDRGILGVARNSLRPIRPESATARALARHLTGASDEWLCDYHERLLGATPENVKHALSGHLDAGMAQAGLCIVANRENLEKQSADPGGLGLEIENILEL